MLHACFSVQLDVPCGCQAGVRLQVVLQMPGIDSSKDEEQEEKFDEPGWDAFEGEKWEVQPHL